MKDILFLGALVAVFYFLVMKKEDSAPIVVQVDKPAQPVNPGAAPNGGQTQQGPQDVFNGILGLISSGVKAVGDVVAATGANRN